MILRSMLACVLAGLLLTGCEQPGRAMVKSEKSGLERISDAPIGAMYSLYAEMEQHPEITCMLKKGDKLGFITENSKRYAVAGEKKIELNASKQYVWKMQDD